MTAPAGGDRAALAALSGLPGIGPRRLRALVRGRSPASAWDDLVAGRIRPDPPIVAAAGRDDPSALLSRWSRVARALDPHAVARQHRAAGVHVLVPGDPGWPAMLADDPDPPSVLFVRGTLDALAWTPTAAVVGTRTASRYGIDVAREFGHDLAAAGVAVVSGLAAGIDGAGHHGALDAVGAPPVGVVGSGLDVVYPRGHRRLWERVIAGGAVVSEYPLGTEPAPWRFPARNRIIAGLADAVVVVESAERGGAMHTVDEAIRRDRPVLAVPGPVTSRASRGTNRLLAEGATPACDAGDVLVALGLTRGSPSTPQAVPAPAGAPGQVLEVLGWQPATLDQLVLRTGLAMEAVARASAELERDGWVASDGGWLERRR